MNDATDDDKSKFYLDDSSSSTAKIDNTCDNGGKSQIFITLKIF